MVLSSWPGAGRSCTRRTSPTLGGAGVYLVTREACERMARTVLPVRAPSDDWLFFHREQAFDRLRCVVPMPVTINTTFRTTIDHYAARSLQTRLRENAVKVPGVKQILARRRQRISTRFGRVELVDD